MSNPWSVITMSSKLEQNLSQSNTWARCLHMLIFAAIFWVAKMVFWFVVVLQFGFLLFSGNRNQALQTFADDLTEYICAILRFLSFGSEDKPFPFNEESSVTAPPTKSGKGKNGDVDPAATAS